MGAQITLSSCAVMCRCVHEKVFLRTHLVSVNVSFELKALFVDGDWFPRDLITHLVDNHKVRDVDFVNLMNTDEFLS